MRIVRPARVLPRRTGPSRWQHACRGALALLAALLSALAAPAMAADATATLPPAKRAAVHAALAAGLRTQTITLRELGAYRPIELRGVDRSAYLPLTVRFDESVVSARLHLNFTFSPSLLPELSQLKVMIDDEPLASVHVSKERLGTPQHVDIDLDPRYFVEFAKLHFEFIGHYTTDCEYPFHTSLWASVSNESTLELVTRRLEQRNDLAMMPAPFFDVRDNRRLELPFVFARQPSLASLRTAGVLASWFGAQSSYRGAHFPALFDALPARHAVLLATNDERPARPALPLVQVPTLAVMTHPDDPAVKLLLVLGRDAEQLRTAAEALVLGQAALSGERVEVRSVRLPQAAVAYRAPNMVKTGERVRIGELVEHASDLQVSGQVLDAIRVNLRLPADIFTWEARGMPVDLHFRYTPPRENGQANLVVRINEEFVQSFALRGAGQVGTSEHLDLPFLEDTGTLVTQGLTVPAFQLGANNQLQFVFDIPPQDEGRCRTTLGGAQAAIDPDSTLDLTHIEHYAAMPNLAFFANSGFPFTKYADLGQTVVIVPDAPKPGEVETALTVLGQFGAATGMAATRFELLDASHAQQADDRDLLVIASGVAAPLLEAWKDTLPARIDAGQRASSTLGKIADAGAEWFSGALPRMVPHDGWAEISAKGPLAAILGFESPLQSGRSVIVLNATDEATLPRTAAALIDPSRVRDLRGDLALLRDDAVQSFRVGDTYYVGHLSWWRWIWFQLHSHPLLLVLLGLLLGVFLALVVFGAMRRMAARRLAAGS
ncbi:Cyclic di-GMP-binding protein [Burkholderiales bacterium]|nr:Cyclic di-GMP-binding protein [Burkholderiales bacterium]